MIKNQAKINENVKSKSLHALKKELLKTKEELHYMKEKYQLLEKNQYNLGLQNVTDFKGQCEKCKETKLHMDNKILERNNILKESLIILRKSMLTWEK